MQINYNSLYTLGLVKELINNEKQADIVLSGTYLKSKKKEIYIVFGNQSLISVFHNGKFVHSFNTSNHKTINDAQAQANFIFDYIKEILDE